MIGGHWGDDRDRGGCATVMWQWALFSLLLLTLVFYG